MVEDISHMENNEAQKSAQQKLVDNSTVQEDVTAHWAHADINMFAANAGSTGIAKRAALSKIDMLYGMRPKYLRYNLWDAEEQSSGLVLEVPLDLADSTEIEKPLPMVPPSEFNNVEAVKTIGDNPDLFKIITPVNVDRFEKLLKLHPNCPFVKSVCKGLCKGFWPWANTQYETYLCIVDESIAMPQKKRGISYDHGISMNTQRAGSLDLLVETYSLACTCPPSMQFPNRALKNYKW